MERIQQDATCSQTAKAVECNLQVPSTHDPLHSHPRFQALLERYASDLER